MSNTTEEQLKSSLQKQALIKVAQPAIAQAERSNRFRQALLKKAMVKSAATRAQAIRSVQWRGFAEELTALDPELTNVAGISRTLEKTAGVWDWIKGAGNWIVNNPIEALSIGLMFVPGIGTVAGGALRAGLVASKVMRAGAAAGKGMGLLARGATAIAPGFTNTFRGVQTIGQGLRAAGWGGGAARTGLTALKGAAKGTIGAGVIGHTLPTMMGGGMKNQTAQAPGRARIGMDFGKQVRRADKSSTDYRPRAAAQPKPPGVA